MTVKDLRAKRVKDAIDRIHGSLNGADPSRETLAEVLSIVRELADEPSLWSTADFPDPEGDARQARYLISEDENKTFALYLNVMQPGRLIPPHNHTTWACIAGVDGEETNTVYDRTDDGSVPGYAEIVVRDIIKVGPTSGIAMMPDDIHSVEIGGDKPIRHLHMYGRALETLNERLTFDMAAKTCRPMPIGVQTQR